MRTSGDNVTRSPGFDFGRRFPSLNAHYEIRPLGAGSLAPRGILVPWPCRRNFACYGHFARALAAQSLMLRPHWLETVDFLSVAPNREKGRYSSQEPPGGRMTS